MLRRSSAAASLWLAWSLLAPAPAAHAADARLLAGDAGAIRFVVDVPAFELVDEGAAGGPVRPRIDGYDPMGSVGDPFLLQRVVTVAVPPAGTVRLSASGATPEVREGVRLSRPRSRRPRRPLRRRRGCSRCPGCATSASPGWRLRRCPTTRPAAV
jgi:hypothetical protein